MFGRERPSAQLKEAETVIGSSVKVEGNFKGKGDVIIEGALNGTLKTSQNLRIGENAKVKANIEAVNISVAGEIKGNVKAQEKLELATSARVFGDIEAKVMSVSQGAILNGKCVMVFDETENKENRKNLVKK